MKTAERILFTALALFNQRGESNVTSVEIADELDISPGNLYYHFKGKEVLVLALLDLYCRQLDKILSSAKNTALTLPEFFSFLYLAQEQHFLFRFFHHNQVELTSRYSGVTPKLQRMFDALKQCVDAQLNQYCAMNLLSVTEKDQAYVSDLIVALFYQPIQVLPKLDEKAHEKKHIDAFLQRVLFVLRPYLAKNDGGLEELVQFVQGSEQESDLHLSKTTIA
ncbi:TetR/AcrR family transcriptional regulator [Aestuariibacter sp. AA17]|uniref:TetR/AcrR family transcriptional regulator n=1 Tax=Fluctibacter corallii TaxID=2984329 RepID=A0ABT3A945_9ALTE|nr:TetR/AcrR family transcriptional regulator [Aestuariibacter sp. AA17]MCV2885114.1 TetR/AcrR family transcriptional regulator [Aestuariibacter sp. AA17]